MLSSSSLNYPSSPSSNSSPTFQGYSPISFKPSYSSPLASSPQSSPVSALQARRRSQYKSNTPVVPSPSYFNFPSDRRTTSRSSKGKGKDLSGVAQDDQKTFMRDRFQKRCLERLHRAREKAVEMGRFASSDGFDIPMDADEDDEEETIDDVMGDVLFSRIEQNENRKREHRLLVSYEREFGSDPDMDDLAAMEEEIRCEALDDELSPEDLEAAELTAYAEEAERLEFENRGLQATRYDTDPNAMDMDIL